MSGNDKLASCPWGPATAHGVGLLIEMYVIYMETCTSHRAIARCFGLGFFMPKIMSVGPTAAAGEAVTDAIMDGRKARIYIKISDDKIFPSSLMGYMGHVRNNEANV